MLRLHVNAFDYIILAIYFGLVVTIGVTARRAVATSEDFLLSGRSLPAWVTGLAFISANLGAIEILGMAANGAQYGLPTVHFYWIGAVSAISLTRAGPAGDARGRPRGPRPRSRHAQGVTPDPFGVIKILAERVVVPRDGTGLMPGGRALVLGGGGVAGIAWMTRVLAGLARAVFSPRAPGCVRPTPGRTRR